MHKPDPIKVVIPPDPWIRLVVDGEVVHDPERPKLKVCDRPVGRISFGFRHYCNLPQGHPGPCR